MATLGNFSTHDDAAAPPADPTHPASPRAEEEAWHLKDREVVDICQRLLRIDTTNYGTGEGPGERAAAEVVMDLASEVGFTPQYFESEDKRATVTWRIEGSDPSLPALIVHGHTDVVPADSSEWSFDPFGGEERDGYLLGRGAVDMKNMDAMILSVVRDMGRRGWRPRRDLVIAMFADEEAGSRKGAHWMVDNHPEVFAGATHAISEVGGYSVMVGGKRVYLIQTAEKGLAWLRLLASGAAGHGSQINEDNAITHLAGALARIGSHAWPIELTGTVRTLLSGVAELTGLPFDPSGPDAIAALIDALGPAARFVGATVRTGANPTQMSGGYKCNVIPGAAEGAIDVRPIPGTEPEVKATLAELCGEHVRIEPINEDVGLEVPFAGPITDAMVDSLAVLDPDAIALPYMLSAGTDNKALSRLGITGYGFTPLQLPEEFDFPAMFHGVDERVPISALQFGTRVLERFLRTV